MVVQTLWKSGVVEHQPCPGPVRLKLELCNRINTFRPCHDAPGLNDPLIRDWIWQIGSTAITTVAIIAVFCGRAAARSKSLARTRRRAPATQTIKEFLHALKPSR